MKVKGSPITPAKLVNHAAVFDAYIQWQVRISRPAHIYSPALHAAHTGTPSVYLYPLLS